MFLRPCLFEQVSSISYSNVAVFVSSAAAAHKVSIVGKTVVLGHTLRRRVLGVFWRVQEGNINRENVPGMIQPT